MHNSGLAWWKMIKGRRHMTQRRIHFWLLHSGSLHSLAGSQEVEEISRCSKEPRAAHGHSRAIVLHRRPFARYATRCWEPYIPYSCSGNAGEVTPSRLASCTCSQVHLCLYGAARNRQMPFLRFEGVSRSSLDHRLCLREAG